MRVAHITFMRNISPGVKSIPPGVQNRILGMAESLNRLGRQHEIDFFLLHNKQSEANGKIQFISCKKQFFPVNFIDHFFRRYALIERAIDLDDYDYVILRYPHGDPSGIRFMERRRVITEHHTFELQHSESYMNAGPLNLTRMAKQFNRRQEKKCGHEILKRARGIIGVTNEIRDFELKRANRPIPSTAISNGILVNEVRQTGYTPFDGKKLELVMLVGSFYPWHGLDRIISGINNYRGNVDIHLHLIGRITPDNIPYAGLDFSKVSFHGFQTGENLDRLMKNMNFAVGPLALHRVGLMEGCTLKVREYTARGIPFILAYKDTDLHGVNKEVPFCLEYNNSDQPLEMNKIIDFVEQVNADKGTVSKYMRQYAGKYMDWGTKIGQYIEFVKQVHGYGNGSA